MATKKWVCWQVLPQSSLLITRIDVYTNIHARYQAFSLKSNSPSDIRSVTWGLSENGVYLSLLYSGSKGIRDLAATSKPWLTFPH